MARFGEHLPPASLENEDDRVRFRVIRRIVTNILQGRVNWSGELVVLAGSITTRVHNDNVRASSAITLTPMEVNAAGMLGAGIWVAAQVESSSVSGVNVGYFDLNHAEPTNDCTFRYAIIG